MKIERLGNILIAFGRAFKGETVSREDAEAVHSDLVSLIKYYSSRYLPLSEEQVAALPDEPSDPHRFFTTLGTLSRSQDIETMENLLNGELRRRMAEILARKVQA